MTAKEAIYWCKEIIHTLMVCCRSSKRRRIGLQAMKVCTDALEKQIPKKLIYDGCYCCPSCGKYHIIEKFRYCPDCGQALDWSDTD